LKPFALWSVWRTRRACSQGRSGSRARHRQASAGRGSIATLASIEPGRYRLRVDGLASDVGSKDSFLVITRPIVKWKMVAAILGIIVSGALALGGLIASVATFVKFQSG
jgi:hypothetical protein